MRTAAILLALLLWMPGLAIGQEWIDYVSRQDGFSINFPGTPQITETTWQSQLNYRLPARVYRAERAGERFSITVVDYSPLEAWVPEGRPEPGLFQQSLGWLDKDGNRIRYTETIYSNSYHGLGVYTRPAYRVSGGGQ
jgi:hypothetical protein